MQIKIGNTLYLGGNSNYRLSSPVQGLESPAIRVGSGVYSGRDGGFVSGHYYGQRTLVLNGFFIGNNCEQAYSLRETLFNLLRIRYRQPIIITTQLGNYYTEGYVSDVKCNLENEKAGKYQITLICPDPFLYKLEGGLEETNTWFSTEITKNTDTIIGNTTGAEIYPIFRISSGTIENPSFKNLTTEKSITLVLEETSIEEELVVDIKHRLITLDGETINYTRSLNSEWWSLISGQNTIIFENSGSANGIISYQKGEIGI